MADPIQIESPQANINRARFAGKDFFTFVDDMVARIQLLYVTEFNDFVSSGTGQMLIDIVAWAAETLSFYIDRQATESYLQTARTRKAVNRLSRNIGYKMSPAVSAATDLELNITQAYGFDVPIPVGFQFQGPSELIFEATENVIFPAGEDETSPSRTVAVREGATRVETFTSDGSRNQSFRLNPGEEKYVADGSTRVTVDGSLWSASEIITFDQTDQYEVSENDVPPLIRFGDGVAGNIPPSGAEIRVEYVTTSGAGGLVQSGTITSVVSPLVVSNQNIALTINNPNPSSGGSEPETLESAKANAPGFFKARNVAITREDYLGLSQSFSDPLAGAVAVAQAFVSRSADDDLTLQALLNNIRAITEPLDDNIDTSLSNAMASSSAAESARSDLEEAVSNEIQPNLDVIVTDPNTPAPSGEIIDIRSEANAIRSDVTDADVLADQGKADGTLGGKDARFDDIKTELADIEARIDTITGKAGTIEQAVFDANAGVNDVFGASGLILTNLGIIDTELGIIDENSGTNFQQAIEDELQAIFDHVDGFLSADCQANLIQVPILTRDVDGFLEAPPIALRRSLETFLEARKEVTQVVEVVSGAPFLIEANIDITVGIIDTFVQATVISNIRDTVDDLLRVRQFGRSLRLSDLYSLIVPDPRTGRGGIDGVDYGVIKITGPVDSLDSDGNIVVTQKEVVSKGTVNISAESVSAS